MTKSTDTGPFKASAETSLEALAELAEQRAQLDDQYRAAVAPHLVDARLNGQFHEAVIAVGLSVTACLRITRRWNERAGRSIRWNDNLDPTSPSSFNG